jgi:C-terminal processing protease CtpA/Prc
VYLIDGVLRLAKPGSAGDVGLTNRRIALLTSGFTASAGEAFVVALHDSSLRARIYGSETFGATNAPATVRVGFYGQAAVASAVVVGRTGHIYSGSIKPDVPRSIDWARRSGSLDDPLVREAWSDMARSCAAEPVR